MEDRRTEEGLETHPGLLVHLVPEVAEGAADLGGALGLGVGVGVRVGVGVAQRSRLFF